MSNCITAALVDGVGVIAAMAGLLADAGVDEQCLRAVAGVAKLACRRVHEIFATTISAGVLGGDVGRRLLGANPAHQAYLDKQMRCVAHAYLDGMKRTLGGSEVSFRIHRDEHGPRCLSSAKYSKAPPTTAPSPAVSPVHQASAGGAMTANPCAVPDLEW